MKVRLDRGTGQGGSPAFSLLEIIVALSLIAILATFFTYQAVESRSEEALRMASTELRKLALKASRQSTAYREESRITFEAEGFYLGEATAYETRPITLGKYRPTIAVFKLVAKNW